MARNADPKQLQFQVDERKAPKDEWPHATPGTGSTTATSSVEERNLREELQASRILHAKTREQLKNLNTQREELEKQLSWTKDELSQATDERDKVKMELQRAKPEVKQQKDESNDELTNLRFVLSQALAERDELKTQLLNEWGQKDQWPSRPATRQLNETIAKLRSELTQALEERDTCKKALLEASDGMGKSKTEVENAPGQGGPKTLQHSKTMPTGEQQNNASLSRMREELSQALAMRDQCMAELLRTRTGRDQCMNELQRMRPKVEQLNADVAKLRKELSVAWSGKEQWQAEIAQERSEKEQCQLELQQLRQRQCAATLAEDELPKVLAHCTKQEELLEQLRIEFKAAQEQLMEQAKALEEVGKQPRDMSDSHMLSSAFSTLRSMRSANSTLRSSLRESRNQDNHWAMLHSAGATWDSFAPARRRKSKAGSERMSRSQVSFKFDAED